MRAQVVAKITLSRSAGPAIRQRPVPSEVAARLLCRALIVASAALIFSAAIEIAGSWRYWSDIDHGAGTWAAMASDLAHGVFYRPVHPPPHPIDGTDRFGGTRYMPLYFVLHAGLLRLGVGIVNAGITISVLAGIGFVFGTYRLLRLLKADPWLAFCGGALLLGAGSIQSGFTATRGDLLAACLNVWGIAFCLRWQSSHNHSSPRRWIFAAAVACFALAFVTKLTTVSGAAACVLWLAACRRWRGAAVLATALAIAATGLLLITAVFSGGRMPAAFAACASGGTSGHYALGAPLRLVATMAHFDQPVALTVLAAICCAVLAAAGSRSSPPPADRPGPDVTQLPSLVALSALILVVTLLATVAIYASPGMHRNHVMELQCAAVVFAVCLAARGATPPISARALLLVVALAGITQTWIYMPQVRTAYDRAAIAATVADLNTTPGPILSEHALLPILCGQPRPCVIDSFSFRVISRRDPAFAQPMWRDLRERRFAGVVLLHDPTTAQGRAWYRDNDFGGPFIDHLLQDYHVAARHGGYIILRPN